MLTHTETAKETKKQKSETAPSLYSLAADALRRNDNDADAAEDMLFEMLSEDAGLLRRMIRSVVKQCVAVNVTTVINNQRASAFASVDRLEKARESAKAGAKALARGIKTALLDMPLADGRRLRDATAAEIGDTATRWERQSATMAHRARWLRAIEAIIPLGKTCGAVLNEKQAAKLFKDAA